MRHLVDLDARMHARAPGSLMQVKNDG